MLADYTDATGVTQYEVAAYSINDPRIRESDDGADVFISDLKKRGIKPNTVTVYLNGLRNIDAVLKTASTGPKRGWACCVTRCDTGQRSFVLL